MSKDANGNELPPINREELPSKYRTKSDMIRDLTSKGYSILEIHKASGLRYQHVRNVATKKLVRDQILQATLKQDPDELDNEDGYIPDFAKEPKDPTS